MATYTSNATGLWSDGATWVGGVKPPSGASHDVVIASTHVVTYNEAAGTYGSGGAAPITVNGTLKASRATSTALTFVGTTIVMGTGGVLDWGTESDPITAGVTAKIYPSAAASHSMVIASTNAWVGLSFWGADKAGAQAVTGITSTTVFDVADATGWLVGDVLFMGPTTSTYTTTDARAITVITPLAGTAATITIGAAPTNVTAVGRVVANVTRNVGFRGANPATYACRAEINAPSGIADDAIQIGPSEWVVTSASTTSPVAGAGLTLFSAAKRLKVSKPVIHDVVSVSGSTVVTATGAGFAGLLLKTHSNTSVVGPLVCQRTSGRYGLIFQAGATVVDGPVLIGTAYPMSVATVSNAAAPYLPTVIDPQIVGATAVLGLYNGYGLVVTGGSVEGWSRITLSTQVARGGLMSFTETDFSAPVLGSINPTDALQMAAQGYGPVSLIACQVPSNIAVSRTANSNAQSTVVSGHAYALTGFNNSVLNQLRYTEGGEIKRENAVVKHGTSSMRFDCWYAENPLSYSHVVTIGAGETMIVRGAMRYTTTYGTTVAPTVTISGLGATPVVATCPLTGVDTWYDYSLSITNGQAYAGDFTVTYSAQSAADSTGAYCYFDGAIDVPWVETVRHYGYLYDNEPHQTADPTITISEAAALALAVSVDHDYQIITVSGALTNAEVYQACMADLAQTASLYPTLRAVHITSDDGEDFETTYDVVLDGGSPTSIITGPYTDAAGRHVLIEAPAIVSGSRVQIYNVTDAVEIYNDVFLVTGIELPVVWSANKTIRLRADHEDKLPLEVAGVLGESGLVFLDIQEDDDVYASNAIDGSTCTEFAPDGANIQIDIDDPDGVTSVRRVYAWLQYYQTTEAGIASDFFGAIEAIDDVNYIVNQAIIDLQLDNISATPVRIIDGYLARKDGSTVIAPSSGSIQMDPRKAYAASDIRDTVTRSEKWLRNKRVTNPSTGTQTVYDDDGVTVLGAGALYEDVAGTQAYRGQGADRADRLA